MNIEPFTLIQDQSYRIELAVFVHEGGEDFFAKAREYDEYIHTQSNSGYVLLKGETGDFVLTASKLIKKANVKCGSKSLPIIKNGNKVTVPLMWNTCGEKKITYEIDGRRGKAYFYVSLPLEVLQERRARFIVKHQQCTDKRSPLYGAFLIYDNEEKDNISVMSLLTPAVCLMLDKYLLSKDEKYIKEAEKHLCLLEKFNGCQPDYRLNKVPIRYWDNYWFGKLSTSVYGDTLPQPSVAHSAHCFYSYGLITDNKKWIDYGLQSWRSGFCLFNGKGEAFSSFVYPERVNGAKGQFFDPFADEQDGFLYLAYQIGEEL